MKTYWVNWYNSNGRCYKSTSYVPKEKLSELKKIAASMGEEIDYEPME